MSRLFSLTLFSTLTLLFVCAPLFTFAQSGNSIPSFNNPNLLDNLDNPGAAFGEIFDEGLGGALNQAIGGCSAIGNFVSDGLQSIVSGGSDLLNTVGLESIAGSLGDLGSSIQNSFSTFSNIPGVGNIGGFLGGGGGAVPVDTVTINEHIEAMRKKETCTDPMSYIASKMTLALELDKITSWIAGGVDQDQLYISSATDYLQNFKDEQFNIFISEASNSDSPIADQVIPSIIETRATSDDSFENRSRYTLDEITGSRAESEKLISGDPSACKGYYWDCWSALIQPQNNSLGYYRLANEEIAEREERAVTDAEARVVEGVAPVLECAEENEYGCIRWETITPATAVKEQLNTAVTSPIRQLEFADQTAETLLPIFGSMLSNFLNAGLQKLFEPNGSGTDSIVDFPATTQTEITTNTSVSLASANGYLSARKTSVNHLNVIIPTLSELPTCYQGLTSIATTGFPIPIQNPVQEDVNQRASYQQLLTSYTREIATLEPLIGSLEDIATRANQTTNQTSIITISTQYQNIARNLPTSAERTSAIEQRNFLAQKKNSVTSALTSCQTQRSSATTTSII